MLELAFRNRCGGAALDARHRFVERASRGLDGRPLLHAQRVHLERKVQLGIEWRQARAAATSVDLAWHLYLADERLERHCARTAMRPFHIVRADHRLRTHPATPQVHMPLRQQP